MRLGEKSWDLAESIAENDGCAFVHIRPASAEAVATVLSEDELSEDGRSEWLWVRLPDGDLILGVYPQGETYFATEKEHP